MLKWTVMNKRQSCVASDENQKTPKRRPTSSILNSVQRRHTISKTKSRSPFQTTNHQRRHSSHNISNDKENQFFNSTPKTKDALSYIKFDSIVLRDVSNITPTNTPPNRTCNKRCRSQPQEKNKYKVNRAVLTPPATKCTIYQDEPSTKRSRRSLQPNFEGREFIKQVMTDTIAIKKPEQTTYASTLPTFQIEYSPCPLRFPKIVNNFLSTISSVTSPEDCMQYTGIKSVTPLTNRFADLRFRGNDSFDKLPYDEMVDAILETTGRTPKVENELNQTQEENYLNTNIETYNEREVKTPDLCSNIEQMTINSVKGIKRSAETTEFTLKRQKCVRRKRFERETNNNLILKNGIPSPSSKTINQNNSITKSSINELISIEQKRRPIIIPNEPLTPKSDLNIEELLRENLEQTPLSLFPGYRKTFLTLPEGIPSPGTPVSSLKPRRLSPNIFSETFTIDPERSQLFGLTIENGIPSPPCVKKDMDRSIDTPYSEPWTPSSDIDDKRMRPRRCLSFDSPCSSIERDLATPRVRRCKSKDNFTARGIININIKYQNGRLLVHVIECRNLCRPNEKAVNAYVKVSLTNGNGDDSVTKERSAGGLHRTAVHKNSSSPYFDQMFCFDFNPKTDINKRIQIAVWHRNREYRRSEFLGCTSFPAKHAIKKEITGSYRLQSQTNSRAQLVSSGLTPKNISIPHESLTEQVPPQNDAQADIMGDYSQSSVEEIISLDEIHDIVDIKSTTKKKLNEQQKVADENIFLRYLELDPTEGPEAIPAALQRKASGNKAGRTPFTTTKRLVRGSESGFGFSVVWTHPPRVERVEKGLPADKAGILPGDYIIFVDKHNVVMMPEIEILNLIRSFGNTLALEIYRKSTVGTSQNGVAPSSRSASVTIVTPDIQAAIPSSVIAPVASSTTTTQRPRSSTACSINTTSDYNRRRLHLPQVTFSSEHTSPSASTPEEIKKRTSYQLIHGEQQFSTAMQFSMGRFVAPLAERTDLLAPSDHRVLFQNSQDLLQLTDDILDSLILEDGEPQIHLIPKVYSEKVSIMATIYKKYCTGIKKADCVLANKSRNTNSDFVRFLHNPAIPRRRPDITGFIHKPLEHYREILKLLQTILANTKSNQEDYQLISKVVQELQITYRDITSNAGLMEPVGEGRLLLSIQDLEGRLVFTRCKPFVLTVPGRQWIFGGDLSRVEGRNIRPYWALLFSDILLFAKVSRDRVLFITEEPLPLVNVTDIFFTIRKKATEFRINVAPGGKPAESPTAHCGPNLSSTPRKNNRQRCVVLRAPNTELKAVWQNLLQKQIYLVHSGGGLTPMSSPMDSPDAPITSSIATLQSADSYSFRKQSNRTPPNDNAQKHLDELIEHKCRQLGKSSNNKGSAIHLAQWMKGQLGSNETACTHYDEPEPVEVWTEEELRRRSRELHLITLDTTIHESKEDNRCESVLQSDIEGSPSKSTTSGSQVTVRSSPLVPEKVPVCRQCHKTCRSPNNNNLNLSPNQCNNNCSEVVDDWSSIMLMGLNAINPTISLVQDPFAPNEVPKISVLPPTPDMAPKTETSFPAIQKFPLQSQKSIDDSPEDSPQSEEPPYLVMVPKNPGLKRYGTWSSLGRIPSDELVEAPDDINNELSSSEEEEETEEEEEEPITTSIIGWTARAGSFVAEKMAMFEKLGEESRAALDRYLRPSEIQSQEDTDYGSCGNGVDEECETSGATSGEEIWGTPTSGGELDEIPQFPNSQGESLSDSTSSANCDDEDLMMDELLMAPPMTAAAVRGLLPRRRLEPLLEEDDSESCTTTSVPNDKDPTPSPDQGSEYGDVADTSFAVNDEPDPKPIESSTKPSTCTTRTPPPPPPRKNITTTPKKPAPQPPQVQRPEPQPPPVEEVNGVVSSTNDKTTEPTSSVPPNHMTNTTTTPRIKPKRHHRSSNMHSRLIRASSYKHIIEDESNLFSTINNNVWINRTRPLFSKRISSIVNNPGIEHDIIVNPSSNRSKSTRLLEFLSGRRQDDLLVGLDASYCENKNGLTGGGNRQVVKLFSRDQCTTFSQRPFSPRRQNDKQLDRRFWKQLQRRRRASSLGSQIPAV